MGMTEEDPDFAFFYENQILKLLGNATETPDGGERRMSVLSRLTRGFESPKIVFERHTPSKVGDDKNDETEMEFGDDNDEEDDYKSRSFVSEISRATGRTTLSMMPGTQGEKEYFKLLWLSNILNTPDVLVDAVAMLDARELYREVLKDGKKFHQFQEWIENRIKRKLAYWDEFIERVDILETESFALGSSANDLREDE